VRKKYEVEYAGKPSGAGGLYILLLLLLNLLNLLTLNPRTASEQQERSPVASLGRGSGRFIGRSRTELEKVK